MAYVDLRRYCSTTENVISKGLPAPRGHESVYGLLYFSRAVSLRGCVIFRMHPTLISDSACHFRPLLRLGTIRRQRLRQSTWLLHWPTMVYYAHLLVPSHRTLRLVSNDHIWGAVTKTTPLVSLSSSLPPALSLSTLIWRYMRQFVRLDAKEALQYVYTVTLGADQPSGIGKEQLELAWDLVRRVIVLANAGPAWDELVGGFRADGMRFVCLFSFITLYY